MRGFFTTVAWLVSTLAACAGSDPEPMRPPDPPAAAKTPQPPETTPNTPMATPTPGTPAVPAHEVATLGNGCFWCSEAVLEKLDGVIDVVSGYSGGTTDSPNYQDVCSGATGHAEVVQVKFDPSRISYGKLLEWFFKSHDPTTLNRQGNDVGTQYRSVIYFHSDAQHAMALAAIKATEQKHTDPVVTEVTKAGRFWPAEDYHQDYFRKNPNNGYCRAVIPPKLKKLGLDK